MDGRFKKKEVEENTRRAAVSGGRNRGTQRIKWSRGESGRKTNRSIKEKQWEVHSRGGNRKEMNKRRMRRKRAGEEEEIKKKRDK